MNSIIVKIVIPFTLLVLVVVGVLATFNYVTTRDALMESANQNLLASARQTVNSLRTYMNSNSSFLEFAMEAYQSLFISYLTLPVGERHGSIQEQIVRMQLADLAAERNVVSYALLDRVGKIWLNSNTPVEETDALPNGFDLDLTDPLYVNKVMLTGLPYISPVVFSSDFAYPVIFFVSRVRDAQGTPIGMLMAVYKASALQEQLALNAGLAGESSFAVLVDENNLRLGHGSDTAALYTFVVAPGEEQTLKLLADRRIPATSLNQTVVAAPDFAAGLANAGEVPFFSTLESGLTGVVYSAAAVNMAETNWTVVFMQPQSVFLEPVNQQTRNTLFLAAGVAGLAVIASLLLGRALAQPIRSLTLVAEKVATGDVNVRAEVKTGVFAAPDELGTLALAFNVMNARQRQARDELESRVEARTADLAKASEQMRYRAAQLQAVSEVARAIASEQDLERLLPLVTQTISERFGYYHVGIFLLDNVKEYAVLRAANSEGGQRMLTRNHKLKIGQVGIIGFVTAQGQPRLALDVGKDAVFFDNPDLSSTRSEVGLPLKFHGEVIGALDAQSTQPSAFSQEDLAVLTTLADQVAIAIENARLFGEAIQTVSELQVAQREYLQKEWSRVVANRQEIGFLYQQGKLTPLSDNLKQMELDLWHDLEAQGFVVKQGVGATTSQPGEAGPALMVPITLRGQVIGAIDLQESDPDRVWTDDEISLARAVAEQVGLALENARLVEETQRRAEREHLVTAITTRLRVSNDPQVILQTAAAELRQALQASTAQVTVQPKQVDSE